ncbi:hypothetical protein D5086_027680 [Populus alba]|uniref:Uncharacterized protein n=1 Tax=Populus alba TaxID=43335 RepID=A0ACC4AW56_POPAL
MSNDMAEVHKFKMKKKRHKAAALIKGAQGPGTEDLKGSSQALTWTVPEMMLQNKRGQLVSFQTSQIQQPQRQRKAQRDGSEMASLKLFMRVVQNKAVLQNLAGQ